MRKVELCGAERRMEAGVVDVENWIPSIARWKVAAIIRCPDALQPPEFNSAAGGCRTKAGCLDQRLALVVRQRVELTPRWRRGLGAS